MKNPGTLPEIFGYSSVCPKSLRTSLLGHILPIVVYPRHRSTRPLVYTESLDLWCHPSLPVEVLHAVLINNGCNIIIVDWSDVTYKFIDLEDI